MGFEELFFELKIERKIGQQVCPRKYRRWESITLTQSQLLWS